MRIRARFGNVDLNRVREGSFFQKSYLNLFVIDGDTCAWVVSHPLPFKLGTQPTRSAYHHKYLDYESIVADGTSDYTARAIGHNWTATQQ